MRYRNLGELKRDLQKSAEGGRIEQKGPRFAKVFAEHEQTKREHGAGSYAVLQSFRKLREAHKQAESSPTYKKLREAREAMERARVSGGGAYEKQEAFRAVQAAKSAHNEAMKAQDAEVRLGGREDREASPKSIETGVRGGRFYISPSGQKIYVGSKG